MSNNKWTWTKITESKCVLRHHSHYHKIEVQDRNIVFYTHFDDADPDNEVITLSLMMKYIVSGVMQLASEEGLGDYDDLYEVAKKMWTEQYGAR